MPSTPNRPTNPEAAADQEKAKAKANEEREETAPSEPIRPAKASAEIRRRKHEFRRLEKLLSNLDKADRKKLTPEETEEIELLGGRDGIRLAMLKEERSGKIIRRDLLEERTSRNRKKLGLNDADLGQEIKRLRKKRSDSNDDPEAERERQSRVRSVKKIIREERELVGIEADLEKNLRDIEKVETALSTAAEARVEETDETESSDSSTAAETETTETEERETPSGRIEPKPEPRKTLRQRLSDWWHQPNGIQPGKAPTIQDKTPGLKELFKQTWTDFLSIFKF